jgi:hypothetical protein
LGIANKRSRTNWFQEEPLPVASEHWAAALMQLGLKYVNAAPIGVGRPLTHKDDCKPESASKAVHMSFESGTSVPEVPHSGENHGDAEFIGCGDHLIVAHRAARLNHCRSSCRNNRFEAVGEGKEGVGGCDALC